VHRAACLQQREGVLLHLPLHQQDMQGRTACFGSVHFVALRGCPMSHNCHTCAVTHLSCLSHLWSMRAEIEHQSLATECKVSRGLLGCTAAGEARVLMFWHEVCFLPERARVFFRQALRSTQHTT
jgi:hypothetical protein